MEQTLAAAFNPDRSINLGLIAFGQYLQQPTEEHRRQLEEYSSSTFNNCDIDNYYIGECSGIFQKTNCWADATWFGLGVCCAGSEGGCCELNPGVIAGIVIGCLAFILILVLICVCAPCCTCCPCNKHAKKATTPA